MERNMILEDFFTLTEMKNGLASVVRVDDLVAVMNREKDNSTKNLGDAARQWTTAGGVLALTESKDCLNRFIQLKGIHFLNLWLQEALKSSADTNENVVEESIEIILKVLKNLPADTSWPGVSGIITTIENLSKQKGIYQEKAQYLVNTWNEALINCVAAPICGEKGDTCHSEDEPLKDVKSSPNETDRGSRLCDIDDPKPEVQNSKDLVSSQDNCSVATGYDEISVPKFDNEEAKNAASKEGVPLSSHSNTSQEAATADKKLSTCPENAPAISEINNPPSPRQNGSDERSSKFSEMTRIIDDKEVETKLQFKVEGGPELNDHDESTSIVPPLAEENGLYLNRTASSDNGGELDKAEHSKAEPYFYTSAIDLSKLPNKLSMSRDEDFPSKTIPDKSSDNAMAKVSVIKGLTRESDPIHSRLLNPLILSEAYKPKLGVNGKDSLISSQSEIELGEEEDALEVARLVGKQVEREVFDYREPSCSISGKNSHGTVQPGSPDSVNHKEEESMLEQPEGVEDPGEHSASEDSDLSPKAKRSRTSSETSPEVGKPDTDSTHSVGPPEESAEQTSKDKCTFDLNEDVFSEEIDCHVISVSNQPISTLSAPRPVVPVSKCVGLPATPLHFEGELGWKGVAATSAFRRASPRKNFDGNKSYLGETSSQGSEQKNNILNIDLNVAENEEDPVIYLGSTKEIPESSGMPSGESTLEVSSKKAENLILDLNQIEDHDEPNGLCLSDRRLEGRFFHHLHQNGNRSPSSVSSSSSRQPSARDFDLNDNPSHFDPSWSHGPRVSHDNRSYGSSQLDDPIISVMGSRMEIDRKDLGYQTHTFLSNGPALEPTLGSSVDRMWGGNGGVRPAVAYALTSLPPFGYNGLPMAPAGAYPPPMYNQTSISYMVDSRGASVIPQIMGNTATGVSPMLSRPPFFVSVTGPPSSVNGGGPWSGLDLNASMGITEGETQAQEMGGIKHNFVQGHHGGLMDEQMKLGLLPGSTGLGLKRKEPECGWERGMPGYKQESSWRH